MDSDIELLQDMESMTTQREKTSYVEVDPIAEYPEEAFKRRYRMSKALF
jgi:hypothetical protein